MGVEQISVSEIRRISDWRQLNRALGIRFTDDEIWRLIQLRLATLRGKRS